MDTGVFDGIVREMGTVSTRRGFARLLGGAAAMGVGLALGAHGDSLAKGKGHGKDKADGHRHGRDDGKAKAQARGRGDVAAQGKKGSVTICYQNQTRTVKKKGYSKKYPGATLGSCPVTTQTPTTTPKPGTTQPPTTQPPTTPPPVACTRWLISGGPNQYDPILADDDLYIFNLSRGGQGILNDENKMASTLPPTAPFEANVGETLNLVGYDAGGCRSLSPLWLHCLATGQKREIFTGFNQGSCVNGAGTFLNLNVTVSL